MYLSIRLSNVRCGRIRKIQKITKMVVLWSTDATNVMGWKELEFHPSLFKIQECRSKEDSNCQKSHCPYYHTEAERRYPLNDHFKLQPKNRQGMARNSQSVPGWLPQSVVL
jgi:hypothetical protein